MKAVKPRTELIILAVAIVAMLLYLLLRDPDRINYHLPALPAIARADLSRIDISKNGQTIRLEKKDGRWLIQPQGYVSDMVKMETIEDAICNLRLTALVSESGNFFPYGLDPENEIVVKAYENERLLREFSVGNVASTYSHTFVKLAGDRRVFHAGKSFRSDFDRKIDDLRDTIVLQFDKNEIAAIEISSGAEKILFSKNVKPVDVKPNEEKPQDQAAPPKTEESWLMANGRPGNLSELNGIIEQASKLNCEGFIAGKSKEDFREPVYTVSFKGSRDYRLTIFQKAEKETAYPALSSESPYPFLLSSYKAENIMKKPDILKNEKTASR